MNDKTPPLKWKARIEITNDVNIFIFECTLVEPVAANWDDNPDFIDSKYLQAIAVFILIFCFLFLRLYMHDRFAYVCCIIYLHTSLCNYLILLDNGPRGA
jgi:hypothetical protein